MKCLFKWNWLVNVNTLNTSIPKYYTFANTDLLYFYFFEHKTTKLIVHIKFDEINSIIKLSGN